MIRIAIPTDYPAMELVFRNSAKVLCADSYDSEVIDEWTKEYRPLRFVESSQQGDQQYVLLVEDNVVCFGSINLTKSLLVSLFVSPTVAGQGIGNKMILHLIAKAIEGGVQRLKIDSSLNAVNFYTKYGFKEVNRSQYRTQSGNYMASVQMVCELLAD